MRPAFAAVLSLSVPPPSQKTIARIGAATVQSALVPLLGIAFYYILSLHFSTAAFGVLSWGNAVSMWLIMIISFGLEQVALRRSAAGNDTSTWVTAAFLYHTISGCVFTAIILFVLRFAFPEGHEGLAILPILFLAQGFNLMVTPLKTLLNARERFLPYAIVSFCSNVLRISSLVWLMQRGMQVTLNDAALLLMIPYVLELAAMSVFFLLRIKGMNWAVKRKGYLRLLREATPQAITVVFDIRLGGRADWILMGLLSSNSATGLYTFAARGFELLRMPISVISMMLMPKLARMLLRVRQLDAKETPRIQQIYRMQMWLAALLVLCMNLFWGPFISAVTAGKYGYTNATEMGILSLALPFHFAQNLFWMLAFSAKKYKAVARITVITSLFNIAANAALIPLFSGCGAATAFLMASIFQAFLYALELRKNLIHLDHRPLLLALFAAACGLSVLWVPLPFAGQAILGLLVYLFLSIPLRLLRRGDGKVLRQFNP
ncbi:MAG: polysaccharide biosynthesis C-terminal domain-containing protein [Bacteroidetes bacterium]|nr:polysaccharide biosynthesis C-terminal domain-containing protein [Bacteroidota bacterium]MBS1630229.1 polysaccharide biosynthesis C-terminal domain-containing protein [Bacteroidota bacterium]